MLELLSYSFIVRGLEAGLIIAVLAPFIGIFLVLRRYSLIADTLAHVSLAGVAVGLLLQISPVLTAIAATTLSSFAIERLRLSKKVYGESALSIFLSGSLALAVVIISFGHGFNTNLFNYLFGSIVTVKSSDLWVILGLGVVVIGALIAFFKELVFISFDEELAKVNGIAVGLINTIFILLAAVTIALAIPIVGVLLIAALVVIPPVTALQLKLNFVQTILMAEFLSVVAGFCGVIFCFYLNLSTGGVIVLITLLFFVLSLFLNRNKH